jgi:lysine 6-dehydrogenase
VEDGFSIESRSGPPEQFLAVAPDDKFAQTKIHPRPTTTMKITVIGAGAIGSAIAADLASRDEVTQVQICDARARSLQTLHEQVQSKKFRSFQLDVRDPNVLEPVIQGSDCLIGCAAPDLNPVLAEMAVKLGTHFCDLGGSDEIVARELALDDRAREAGVWIVPNCGLAPGLANILCMRGMDAFDEVDAVRLRVGDVPLYPQPPFNFRISWSAERILDDYTNPVLLIRDGKVIEDEPLSHCEHVQFDEPFGTLEAFCTAGGLSTLTSDLEGRVRDFDHKTLRWPGHASQMAFLLGLGLGESRIIDVRTHLTFRDVLVRRLRQRLGGDFEDAVLVRIVFQGTVAGERKTLVYQMIQTYDAETGKAAIRRCASVPTAVVATIIASGGIPGGGAAPPERILPIERFLELIGERGLSISEQWYDGFVESGTGLEVALPQP